MNAFLLPQADELPENLKQVLSNPNPKMLMGVASGLAPLAPRALVEAWVYLRHQPDPQLAATANKSLRNYPEKMLLGVLQAELAPWALADLSSVFEASENILEAILLNQGTPDFVFVSLAKICTERLTQIIANNQEIVIQAPEVIPALESNPHNLKSNTDRLRHFLGLAGIFIPGGPPVNADEDKVVDEKAVQGLMGKLGEDESAESLDSKVEAVLKEGSRLNEDQRLNLRKYITQLNVGGRIKLAFKGNKEARQILIRDVNAIVSCSVLKSPRISENEVALYASLRNVCDDVIRQISVTPGFTKAYQVKLALCLHPKCPLQASTNFIKFLTLRDLQKVSKDRNIQNPLKKAAKELLNLKRK